MRKLCVIFVMLVICSNAMSQEKHKAPELGTTTSSSIVAQEKFTISGEGFVPSVVYPPTLVYAMSVLTEEHANANNFPGTLGEQKPATIYSTDTVEIDGMGNFTLHGEVPKPCIMQLVISTSPWAETFFVAQNGHIKLLWDNSNNSVTPTGTPLNLVLQDFNYARHFELLTAYTRKNLIRVLYRNNLDNIMSEWIADRQTSAYKFSSKQGQGEAIWKWKLAQQYTITGRIEDPDLVGCKIQAVPIHDPKVMVTGKGDSSNVTTISPDGTFMLMGWSWPPLVMTLQLQGPTYKTSKVKFIAETGEIDIKLKDIDDPGSVSGDDLYGVMMKSEKLINHSKSKYNKTWKHPARQLSYENRNNFMGEWIMNNALQLMFYSNGDVVKQLIYEWKTKKKFPSGPMNIEEHRARWQLLQIDHQWVK